MSTLVSLDARPLATSAAHEFPAAPRWKRVYATGICLVLACALSFIAVFRAASVWTEKAQDDSTERRSQIEAEISRWIGERPSTGVKASVLAYGGLERGLIPHESCLEAMIDDPGKPANARLSICRFTLNSSGSIIDVVERSVPSEVPR